MFGKSVRFQFVLMGILYLLFAGVIIFQMYYVTAARFMNSKISGEPTTTSAPSSIWKMKKDG